MAIGSRYIVPYETALDAEGVSLPGAKLYFYMSGTATPLDTFSDVNLTFPNTNPVIADAGGLFPSIFLQVQDYKVVLKDNAGNEQWTADPVSGIQTSFSTATNATDLRNLAILPNQVGTLVYLEGYHTVGDGGRGWFLIMDQNPGPDDGGVIFWSTTAGYFYKRDTQELPYSVKWFGAYGDNVHDDTAAINSTIATGRLVYLPASTYLISAALVFDNPHPGMFGDGMTRSTLRTTQNAADGIVVGSASPAQYITLRDFGITGTSTNPSGLRTGSSATNYCANLIAERLKISGFSTTTGINLRCVQQTHFIDCVIINNHFNVYRPDTTFANGYLTTVEFSGSATDLSLAGAYAVWCEGTVSGLTLRNVVMEDIGRDAILVSPPVNFPQGSQIYLDRCYFEGNNTSGLGDAEIVVDSVSDPYHQTILVMQDCEFHGQANSYNQIGANYAVLDIQRTGGFDLAKVAISANTEAYFGNNSHITNNAALAINLYLALPGDVTADDIDYFGWPYSIRHGIVLGLPVVQTNTTPVALTNATAKTVVSLTLKSGDWDIFGQLTFTGNAATTVTRFLASITLTPDSIDLGIGNYTAVTFPAPAQTVFVNGEYTVTIGPIRASFSGSLTYYLSAQSEFAVNSCSAKGIISANSTR